MKQDFWEIADMLTRMGFVAVLMAVLTAHNASGDKEAGDLTLKMEQVSGPLYPLQALQVRLSLQNAGKKRAGPLDFCYTGVLIKGPRDEKYRALAWLPSPAGRNSAPTALQYMNGKVPLVLDPGERLYVSFAVAAEWEVKWIIEGKKQQAVNHGNSIFPEPGNYSVKCAYLFEGVRLEQTIQIDVRAPKDENESVFQLLQKDPLLASALMCPLDVPQEALIPKLKDIIERFPKSSYTDYARFALARGYWGGSGVYPFSRRVAAALAADQLEKVVANLRWEPKLKKLVPNSFAYLPDALVLFKWAEPAARMGVLRKLDREFPDAIVWLEEVASSLGSGEPEKRQLVELILNRKIPDDPAEVRAFIIEGWRSYRKKAPRPPDEEKRPPP